MRGRGASSGDSVHTPTSGQTGALLGERTEAPLGRGQVTNAITGPRSPGHHQLIRTILTKNKSRPGLSHLLIVVLIPQYDGYDNMIPVSRVSELLAATHSVMFPAAAIVFHNSKVFRHTTL